ncbi:MAG TPA: hypothetical protein VLK34_03015 [Nocardioidaceae bacterium]|nr:hypothetical protein [Nocardioidaceae bacterium]
MFIQVIQGRVSDKDALRAQVDKWRSNVAPGATGWLGSTSGVTADGRSVAVVRFESEDAARLNEKRPEQDAWWSETAALFDGDPTFAESGDVDVEQEGDPSSAGFVQVMRGQSSDPERARAIMNNDSLDWRSLRPDVLAMVSVNEPGGRWTNVIYFPSEAAAREGEAKPMPPEAEAMMGELMSLAVGEVEYFDLTDPWLHAP